MIWATTTAHYDSQLNLWGCWFTTWLMTWAYWLENIWGSLLFSTAVPNPHSIVTYLVLHGGLQHGKGENRESLLGSQWNTTPLYWSLWVSEWPAEALEMHFQFPEANQKWFSEVFQKWLSSLAQPRRGFLILPLCNSASGMAQVFSQTRAKVVGRAQVMSHHMWTSKPHFGKPLF